MELAVVAITPGGAALARRLGAALPGAAVHLPARFRAADGCRYFDGPLAELLPRLFAGARGLVCIMATGIVVRLLAPHLAGKGSDPGVVVVDEAGRFAVSLLSGHLGGGNALAREVAAALGGEAVITTATDVNGLPAWDEVARLENLAVEPLAHVRRLNGLLLEGRRIALVDRRGRVARHFSGIPSVATVATFAAAHGAAGRVFVTHRRVPELEAQPDLLLLRPRDLVVGLGCNRGTAAEEIAEAVEEVLRGAFLAAASVGLLATIDAKRDEEGLMRYAESRGLAVAYYPAAALNAVAAPAYPSPHALAAVGAKGVCEPAALLSAGGSLLVRKQRLGNVTVAVAERPA